MVDLDDKKALLELQGGDTVLQSIDNFPKQLEQSWQESKEINLPSSYKNVKNIVVCGMGGSRFPALIIKHLFKEELRVPLVLNDNYTLPGFVNEQTLVLLSSYSGTTEEVLACAKAALNKEASILGITTGGDLATLLKQEEKPIYVFNPAHNPSGQPRIGVGYAIGGILGLLHQLDLVRIDSKKVESAIISLSTLLQSDFIDVRSEKNPAKQMAQKLFCHYPYYIVSEFLTGCGNALANQTNETAKVISSFRVIPELNHHLMEGLKFPKEHPPLALFVFFNSSLYSAPVQKRFEITKDVVEQNEIETYWHTLRGKTKIEQAFELVGFGGYLTMYLSALYGQDPTVIPFVDYFKKKLKES